MAVLRPLKLVIENWPQDPDGHPIVEWFEIPNNPENPDDGVRSVPFSGVLFIEAEDFAETPPPKFFRLSPGREVRLRGAYLVTATGVVKDNAGRVIEVRATFDPASRGGSAPDGRKVKSTMHWVSADHAVPATVALYDHLFSAEVPGERTGEPLDDLNPASRETILDAKCEPILAETPPGAVVQFERLGYFAADPHVPGLFHRTVTLRDEWARIQARASGAKPAR
jgi:glutaminyl-tRNA synthetase